MGQASFKPGESHSSCQRAAATAARLKKVFKPYVWREALVVWSLSWLAEPGGLCLGLE